MRLDEKKGGIILLVICALLVGVIHIFPSIYVRLRLGSDYRGIFPLQSADEEHYAVQIHAAMNGYYNNANNYLAEGWGAKSKGFPPFYPYPILGFIGGISGLSIGAYIIAMRFVFPAVGFLLIYALFLALGVSRRGALAWAFLNLLAPYLFYGWAEPVSRPVYDVLRKWGFSLLWHEQYAIASLPWARVVNPQFTGLFFAGAVFCLVKIVRGGRALLWLLPAAIFLYINFRFYFYFWSTLGAILATAFLFSILFRNKRAILPLGVLLLLGIAKALPFASRLIIHPDVSGVNVAYVLSHNPVISPACVGAIILLLAGGRYHRQIFNLPADAIIFFTMPIVCLITMNQQLITGRIVQPWHYELFTSPLLLSVSLAILLWRMDMTTRMLSFLKERAQQGGYLPSVLAAGATIVFFFICAELFFYYFHLAPGLGNAMHYITAAAIETLLIAVLIQILLTLLSHSSWDVKRLSALTATCVAVFIVLEGFSRQAYISALTAQRARPLQALAPAFTWLNQNTAPGSAVLASFATSELIPLYAHNTVYLCKNAFHEPAGTPDARRSRAMNYFLLTGHNAAQFRQRLFEWPYGYLFWGIKSPVAAKNDLYSFGNLPPVSEEFLKNLLVIYEQKGKNSISSIAGEFTLNYIFFGPEEHRFFHRDPASLEFARKVYEDKTPITIYQVERTGTEEGNLRQK
jgi:hypothetical protein